MPRRSELDLTAVARGSVVASSPQLKHQFPFPVVASLRQHVAEQQLRQLELAQGDHSSSHGRFSGLETLHHEAWDNSPPPHRVLRRPTGVLPPADVNVKRRDFPQSELLTGLRNGASPDDDSASYRANTIRGTAINLLLQREEVVRNMSRREINELIMLKRPPDAVRRTILALALVLGHPADFRVAKR